MRPNSLRLLVAFLCAGSSLGLSLWMVGERGAAGPGTPGKAGEARERSAVSKAAGSEVTGAKATRSEAAESADTVSRVPVGSLAPKGLPSEGEQSAMGAEATIPTSIAALRHSAAVRGYVVRDIRWDPVLQRTWAIFESATHPERPTLAVLTQLTDSELAAERASVEARAAKVVEFQSKPAAPIPIDWPTGAPQGLRIAMQTGLPTDTSLLALPRVSTVSSGFVATIPQAAVVHSGDRVVLWSEEKNLRLQLNAVVEENGAVGDRVRLHLAGRSGDQWGGDPTSRPIRGVVRGPGEVEMEP